VIITGLMDAEYLISKCTQNYKKDHPHTMNHHIYCSVSMLCTSTLATVHK